MISTSQIRHFHLSFAGRFSAPFSENCHYLLLVENPGGNSQLLLCLWLNDHSSLILITWKTVKCQVNMAWLMWQSQDQALALGSTSMNKNIWQKLLIRVYIDETGQDFHSSIRYKPRGLYLPFEKLIWLCFVCFMRATIMDEDQICRFWSLMYLIDLLYIDVELLYNIQQVLYF